MPVKWEITLNVPFGDIDRPVSIYTHCGWSYEIFIDNGREGSIGWMRRGWKFHTHKNTSLTTADFIVLAEIIEECCPFRWKIDWLEKTSFTWPRPPWTKPHIALLMYPKLPKVRHW